MCKLNSSKLRAAGVTAFEIEILKYITDNNITPGTTFAGAPGHPRYGTSKQQVTVYRNDADVIEFGRATASGEIKRTINVAEYGGGRKATTNTNTNNDKNNNNMDTTTATTAPTPAPAAGLDVLNSLFAQQQQIGYNTAKQESAALIADLQAKIKGLQDKDTGTVINVTINGETKKTTTDKILDPNFENILNLVASGENVYLYGPAGSGKNVICEEIAKALDVKFYYQNTILTKFDVSGYKNAKGEFENTPFYNAWKNGGLIMFDEFDNSQAEAIIALNAALANGYYTFPDSGERVEKHPNFRCMAAGNTNGQGATDEYCGRYQMDESSRDRFAFIKIDYNEKIEKSIAGVHTDVVEFIHDIRQAAAKLHIKLIAGYRAIGKLCKFYDSDVEFTLNAYIFKGMNIDDINQISGCLCKKNRYTDAITKMVK